MASSTERKIIRRRAAERQAAHRRRVAEDSTKVRLNLIVDTATAMALRRLAKAQAVTQAELLHRLLIDEQSRFLASRDSDASNAYFDAVSAG